jgi:hypothetical protein
MAVREPGPGMRTGAAMEAASTLCSENREIQ